MNANDWKNHITLNDGESLVHQNSRTSGFMGEEDIDTYAIQRVDGIFNGSVIVKDHTAVKGFRRTIYVVQMDINNKIIFEKRYEIPKS